MRRALVAVVTALLVAAPAAAQTPPPTHFSFESTVTADEYTATLEPSTCSVFRNTPRAHTGSWYLYAPCAPTLRLTFRVPQASVELFAQALLGTPNELVATAHTTSGTTVPLTVRDPSIWKPVAFAGVGSIDYVELRAAGADIGVDDLAISTEPQPDTGLLEAPPARTGDTATFRFEANRPDVTGWRCTLDGAAPAACTSPITYSGLAAGPHTFRVAAVDAYGAVDPTPVEHAWTVLGPLPETPRPSGVVPTVDGDVVTLDLGAPGPYECSVDGGPFAACATPFTVTGLPPGPHTIDVRAVDADGRPDPTPERWTFDVPNVHRDDVGTDRDRDHIPDDQETLPLGNVKPVAGVRTLARLISGRVYVKLPRRTTKQLSGFVPLKGIAALPVGTTVDARRGTLSLQTALDGRRAKQRKLGRARLSAAIFQIRQARLKPRARRARRIATNLLLRSPGTASARCRASRRPRAIPVRTLKATAKGLFRVSGGASHAVARNAAWTTTDRCNGTVTRVTRGRVNVYDKGRRRHIVVRRNHRYVAKARLFLARKGRRATPLRA
ncbi:MAG TPA: hypothetical protein VFG79_06025 [Solirubrobacter sp.]|nr:hypothetical protein [Solirubrobacter sp.]